MSTPSIPDFPYLPTQIPIVTDFGTFQQWDLIYWPLIAIFGGNLILGIIVQICLKKDNSWIDAWWSVSFLIPNIVVLVIRAVKYEAPMSARMWLITACQACWTLRLSTYIFIRHKREDYRYKEMREDWTKQGVGIYYLKAFGFVYLFQGLCSLINNGSVLFVNIFSLGVAGPGWIPKQDLTLTYLDIIGAVVWLAGFIIEVGSDKQLANHLARPKPGTGKFIKSGFWRYSRHPNYFGEAVMWWGLWLIALNMNFGWVTIYAPIFITIFLRFVSGVPFPEKKYANNPEWQAYCKETNVFCLWFYKDNSGKVDPYDQAKLVTDNTAETA